MREALREWEEEEGKTVGGTCLRVEIEADGVLQDVFVRATERSE